jgi:hypothetical protein
MSRFHRHKSTVDPDPPPPHPYWCDECGGKAAFRMKGFPIDHFPDCTRRRETEKDAEAAYDLAKAWCKRNPGRKIP